MDFHENIGEKRFEADIETVIYRICREAAANACKYSGSGRIETDLFLDCREDDSENALLQSEKNGTSQVLRLEIRDDGKGFNTENIRITGGGMGLPGMHYWAAGIGAKLTVRSAPGKGTCVILEIPIEEK